MKIEKIDGLSVPRKCGNGKKSARPTLKNLPIETIKAFNDLMLFEAYNMVGELNPWAALPDETIADMWNRIFGDDYPVAIQDSEEGDYTLFTVIKRLVSSFCFFSCCVIIIGF